ncbi:hypothetical protein [Collimonas fungivorans]|uniref:Uncharacterized protein n=1 Tax=Collimonas fungivorans (strain Ter331) TaxID=1005048 RepID=G0AHH7_COLFT|nr:hypothetical protein [Collimonas fungivorans]AEK60016.1 hypothetical protein CFU_0178 [Collimonas fungivorans Ter331]
MSANAKTAVEPWLAGTADPDNKPALLSAADRLASMEKLLAAFMQTLDRDEDAGAPHLMGQHRGCPCCSERGE